MNKVYILSLKVMNGTVLMKEELSVFTDKHLAEECIEILKDRNKDSEFDVVYEIIENIPIYNNRNEVPLLIDYDNEKK